MKYGPYVMLDGWEFVRGTGASPVFPAHSNMGEAPMPQKLTNSEAYPPKDLADFTKDRQMLRSTSA